MQHFFFFFWIDDQNLTQQSNDLSPGGNALTLPPNVVKTWYSSVSPHKHPSLLRLPPSSPSLPPPPFISLFFPLCRSWQANLNLFHCDMTQQLHCSSGASSLGAPAASASSSPSASQQPALRALARHAPSWGFSDCCVQKNSPLCHYKSVICPLSASGACCRFFTHSAAFEVHVRLWCHAALYAVLEAFA